MPNGGKSFSKEAQGTQKEGGPCVIHRLAQTLDAAAGPGGGTTVHLPRLPFTLLHVFPFLFFTRHGEALESGVEFSVLDVIEKRAAVRLTIATDKLIFVIVRCGKHTSVKQVRTRAAYVYMYTA